MSVRSKSSGWNKAVNMAGGRETCSGCKKSINTGSKSSVQCHECESWLHKGCTNLETLKFVEVQSGERSYTCGQCTCEGEVNSAVKPNEDTDSDNYEDDLNVSNETTVDLQSTTISELLSQNRKLVTELHELRLRVTSLEATVATLSKVSKQTTERMNLNNLKQVKIEGPKPPRVNNFSQNVIRMKEGDILETPNNITIAHCVGQDFLMTDGLAAKIKTKFKINVESIKNQARVGQALLQQLQDGRHIIHLVTKEETHSDPLWKNFKKAIYHLAELCYEKKIPCIVIPKLGCGLDKLHWPQVMRLLNGAFAHTNTSVTVLYLSEQQELLYRESINNDRIRNAPIDKTKRIYVIGDSHVRDYGSILNSMTDSNTKCFANCTPGGTSEIITKDLNSHVTHLQPKDTLVYISGTNDIYLSKNGPAITPANDAKSFVLSHSMHTNVIIANVPRRLDKPILNQGVDTYNNNLYSIVNDFKSNCEFPERVQILDLKEIVTDDMYEKDGLHIKEIFKYEICTNIIELVKQSKNQPFRNH